MKDSTPGFGSNAWTTRRVTWTVGTTALLSFLLIGAPTVDARKPFATLPVTEIRPGMRGHAVTVFQGEATDKFEIEIVDVIPNYLPQQDAVLFKSNDPRMVHSGIVGGMSGSPIYIEGKLVGALAYGWRFNKDALGALTPIDAMRRVGELPFRPDVLPRPRLAARSGTRGWADAMLGLETSPLPARRRADDLDPSEALTPLALPMSVSGFGPGATRMLADTFGMIPVRGGSGRGGAPAEPAPAKTWAGGDAVSVVMVKGDSAAAANGTVTWVGPKGDRLLAFGHPMFEDGPTNVPIADARVHTIVSSVDRSVKVSSPLTIRGLMYQDRQAAIALRTDARAPMVPVTTTIRGPEPDLAPRTYANEVAIGVDMTPQLVATILAEAVDEAGQDAADVVLHVVHEISLETTAGPRDLHIEEEVFFPLGTEGRVMTKSRGVLLLAAALDNDFEVAKLRGIVHTIRMEYGAPVETIEAVRLREGEVHAGALVRLELTLRDYRGTPRQEVLPIRIPSDAGGEEIEIEITGGDFVRPYRPLPDRLDDLLTTIEASYPSRALVATIYRTREGLSTRHGLLAELPDSVLETLDDRGSTRGTVRLKQMSRRVIPTAKLIEGSHSLRLDVLPPTTF